MTRNRKGDWITNVPRSIKTFWPRRKCLYYEGPPHETDAYSQKTLIEMNIVGVYLAEDIEVADHNHLPRALTPKEYDLWLRCGI